MMYRGSLDVKKVIPYTLVLCELRDKIGYAYYGEAMSYPFPEPGSGDDLFVNVRRVPGHPGTLEKVALDRIQIPFHKLKYVHYAQVFGIGQFPVDMLRYDMAAPVNFTPVERGILERDPELEKQGIKRVLGVKVDPSFGLPGLWIAATTPTGVQPWCTERWRSFLWSVKHIKTETVENARNYETINT
jgi:hypothetical protein